MNILITICARASSKGLPQKNILPLNGKPLFLWTVEQAIKWQNLDWHKRVICLSSDSKTILECYKLNLDIIKIKRPEELAQDNTPKLDVIRHALQEVEREIKYEFPIIIDLDVTNPLRTIQDIENCYQMFLKEMLLKEKPDTLFSVTRARKNPYFNMIKMISDDNPFEDNLVPELCIETHMRTPTRRQDAPEVYDINSCIYIYDRDWLLDKGNRSPIGDNSRIYVMKDWQAFDIDNEVDFKIVEMLMREYHEMA
jgi:CMP-N-acetylneuraminic acid synthetase